MNGRGATLPPTAPDSLALARPRGDYLLIIDADDTLDVPEAFRIPSLDADSYTIEIDFGGTRYRRPQIVNCNLPWRFDGVIHEFLMCEDAKTSGHLPLVMRISQDGARRRDPETYRKDAALLENVLKTETSPFLQSRYTFYLAQSYRDCGERQKALAAYLARAALGHWDQEIFFSLYQAAQLMEALGHGKDDILATYQRATDACPSRAEASHGASRLCRLLNDFARGYVIAKQAAGRAIPLDGLFVQTWIYEYGLLDEYAVNAYWAGHYRDCLDASLRALEAGTAAPGDQRRFVQNARLALDKLPGNEDG